MSERRGRDLWQKGSWKQPVKEQPVTHTPAAAAPSPLPSLLGEFLLNCVRYLAEVEPGAVAAAEAAQSDGLRTMARGEWGGQTMEPRGI